MPHILIVEDNDRIASFLEKGLRSAGYQTEVVADGRSGLTLACLLYTSPSPRDRG